MAALAGWSSTANIRCWRAAQLGQTISHEPAMTLSVGADRQQF